MRFIKRSARARPKVSLILLDWSVRESFHLLHYLSKQSVDRDSFEVIVIEYYSRVSEALREFQDQVDTWVLLEMPESCYYHKHLMYNVGIVLSRGDICVICDSDAMVKEGFIETIIGEFRKSPETVLHLDQFRNMRRDFYPFNYPSFEEVIGRECINNVGGKTRGILDFEDAIHTRNYGACMCARREDLIAIGGADEHMDYLGHICGPYDMTFRLVSKGKREAWHQSEFMYHTWHPGQAGVDNYLGPHDGRHVSTTALEALTSRRVMPLLENEAIRSLRAGSTENGEDLLRKLIRPGVFERWNRTKLEKDASRLADNEPACVRKYKGFAIRNEGGVFYAHLLAESYSGSKEDHSIYFDGTSLQEVRRKINKTRSPLLVFSVFGGRFFILLWQTAGYVWLKVIKRLMRLPTDVSGGRFFILLWHMASYVWLLKVVKRLVRLPTDVIAFSKALHRRLQQFFRENAVLEDSLSDIISNLYYIRTVQPDLAGAGAPILLVDSKRFELYLKMMFSIRAVPPLQICRIASYAQLKEFLDNQGASGAQNPIILARGAFIRYYSILSANEHAKNLVII